MSHTQTAGNYWEHEVEQAFQHSSGECMTLRLLIFIVLLILFLIVIFLLIFLFFGGQSLISLRFSSFYDLKA